MINVITADDHALIRKGVCHILEKCPDIHVVDEAENGHQLLKKLRAQKTDVIVLDLSMPGMDIFDLLKKIKAMTPEVPILMLSMHPEEQFGLQVMKAGAAGYLSKSGGLNDLAKAIRLVHNGRKYISDALAEKMADRLIGEETPLPHEGLSEREFQVLCLIGSGKTVSEIAEELHLSVKTVSTYRSRLLEKMELDNNAQITYYAIQHRLV